MGAPKRCLVGDSALQATPLYIVNWQNGNSKRVPYRRRCPTEGVPYRGTTTVFIIKMVKNRGKFGVAGRPKITADATFCMCSNLSIQGFVVLTKVNEFSDIIVRTAAKDNPIVVPSSRVPAERVNRDCGDR